MSLEDDIHLLRKVQLLSDFGTEHLRLISFGSQKLSFNNGHELFRQGQQTDCGYVILSGSVELFSFEKEGAKLLQTFRAGSLLGEMALISSNKRIGTAIVKDNCELMKISRETMHRILNEYPELAVALQARISKSVLDFTREIDKVHI